MQKQNSIEKQASKLQDNVELQKASELPQAEVCESINKKIKS